MLIGVGVVQVVPIHRNPPNKEWDEWDVLVSIYKDEAQAHKMQQKDSDILWLSDGILGLTDSMQKTCNDPLGTLTW